MLSEPMTFSQTLGFELEAGVILILESLMPSQGVLVEQLRLTTGFPLEEAEPMILLNSMFLMVNDSSPLEVQ